MNLLAAIYLEAMYTAIVRGEIIVDALLLSCYGPWSRRCVWRAWYPDPELFNV